MRVALVEEGVVTNIIEVDEDWTPPEGTTTVYLPPMSMVNKGWLYDLATEQFTRVDDSGMEETTEQRIRRLRQYLAGFARVNRLTRLGLNPEDPDTASSELMMVVEALLVVNERAAGRATEAQKGRADRDFVPKAERLLSYWNAQKRIDAMVQNGTYTTESEIVNSTEWP